MRDVPLGHAVGAVDDGHQRLRRDGGRGGLGFGLRVVVVVDVLVVVRRVLGHRVFALAMHLLGRLNGIEHAEGVVDVMRPVDSVLDLDKAQAVELRTANKVEFVQADAKKSHTTELPLPTLGRAVEEKPKPAKSA